MNGCFAVFRNTSNYFSSYSPSFLYVEDLGVGTGTFAERQTNVHRAPNDPEV